MPDSDNGQSDLDIEVTEKQADPKTLERSVIDSPLPTQTPSIQSNLLMFLGGVSGEFESWGQNVKQRDRQLRQFITTESIFTSALGIICARNAGFNWVLEGPEQTVALVQERLEASNQGKGWEDFIVTTSNDLYTQDAGSFIEIVRDGDSPESAFLGLNHLDSSRCWHSGNPEKPVLYQDRVGRWHLMDWWNVIELSEMPAGLEGLPGIQYCLDEDAAVRLADGSTERISKLVKEEYSGAVMSLGPTGRMEPKRVIGWYKNPLGERRLLNVRGKLTQIGGGSRKRNSWVTEDHPILTPDGWMPAGDLRDGCRIVTERPQASRSQMELIVGTLLGDASLINRSKNPRLCVAHKGDHREWIEYKAQALGDFSPHIYVEKSVGSFTHMLTKAQPSFVSLAKEFYPDGKKGLPRELIREYLSPRMLAAWYLDDGSIDNPGHPPKKWKGRDYMSQGRRPSARIGISRLSFEDADWLAEILTERGYDARVCSNGDGTPHIIKMLATGGERFFGDIGAYAPPCMRYKLSWNAPDFDPSLWELSAERFIDEVEVRQWEDVHPKRSHPGTYRKKASVYCLDVEDNHNFVSAGMVMHNCALTRLLLAAEIVKNISIYKNEKAGGRHNRALHLVSGVTAAQINAAIDRYALYADAKGQRRYVNPIVIPAVDSDSKISHEIVELASLPDNFDEDAMYKWYIAQIAMAFLTDYQEFAPLPGGNLGSSTQSEVLHLKSRGKGSGLFMNLITRALNFRVLPKGVTFKYLEQDLEAEEIEAGIRKTRAETREIQVRTGEITSEQATQMSADAGDILQEFLTADITPDVTVPGEEPVEKGADEVTIPELIQRAKQEGGDGEHAGPFDDEYFASVERYATALLKALKKIQANVNRGLRTNLSKEVTFAVPDSVEFWVTQEQIMLEELSDLPAQEMRVGTNQAARLGLTFDFAMVNEDVLRLAGTYTDAWWETFEASTRDALRGAIQANIESGEPLQALTKKLNPLFGPTRAELIASTEVTRLYAEGNAAAYREAGVTEVEFRTVQDSLVDADCASLDGTRFPVGMVDTRPPIHPRCRCFISPVVDNTALTRIVS